MEMACLISLRTNSFQHSKSIFYDCYRYLRNRKCRDIKKLHYCMEHSAPAQSNYDFTNSFVQYSLLVDALVKPFDSSDTILLCTCNSKLTLTRSRVSPNTSSQSEIPPPPLESISLSSTPTNYTAFTCHF